MILCGSLRNGSEINACGITSAGITSWGGYKISYYKNEAGSGNEDKMFKVCDGAVGEQKGFNEPNTPCGGNNTRRLFMKKTTLFSFAKIATLIMLIGFIIIACSDGSGSASGNGSVDMSTKKLQGTVNVSLSGSISFMYIAESGAPQSCSVTTNLASPNDKFAVNHGENKTVSGLVPGLGIAWTATVFSGHIEYSGGDGILRIEGFKNKLPFLEMVFVSGGSFQLGKEIGTAGDGDATPVSTVTLAGFYMGKYEVTQKQYQAVMGGNPSHFASNPVSGETQNRRPVEQVSWYDAIVFCNKLSMVEGLTPAYRINGSTDPAAWGEPPYFNFISSWEFVVVGDVAKWDSVSVVSGSTGYRLPTEAQWEYAAKGGASPSGNYTYAGSNSPDGVAWYYANSNEMTHEVGKKAPNGLGLYDMSGNVWEWCWDWYGEYTSTAKTDSLGASTGPYRVIRGGDWDVGAGNVRSVYRYDYNPYYRNVYVGFRLVSP